MKLYVGNIPALASEAALQKWFAEAGVRVESIHFIREEGSGALYGFCFVDLGEADIPKKDLRHLNKRAFWGRPLAIQAVSPEIERRGTSELKAWFMPGEAADRSRRAALSSWRSSSL